MHETQRPDQTMPVGSTANILSQLDNKKLPPPDSASHPSEPEGAFRAGVCPGALAVNSELERTLAFWIQFAEIWANLANHSTTAQQRA
jgi:hypothetical protein